jgi:hypothetical protein
MNKAFVPLFLFAAINISAAQTSVPLPSLHSKPDLTITIGSVGSTKTTFTNDLGTALIWHASFCGNIHEKVVNVKPFIAKLGVDNTGNPVFSVTAEVRV